MASVKDPVELRVTANGRPIEVRRVTPSADGAPIHAVFTVSPEPDVPTVYTLEIPGGAGRGGDRKQSPQRAGAAAIR